MIENLLPFEMVREKLVVAMGQNEAYSAGENYGPLPPFQPKLSIISENAVFKYAIFLH